MADENDVFFPWAPDVDAEETMKAEPATVLYNAVLYLGQTALAIHERVSRMLKTTACLASEPCGAGYEGHPQQLELVGTHENIDLLVTSARMVKRDLPLMIRHGSDKIFAANLKGFLKLITLLHMGITNGFKSRQLVSFDDFEGVDWEPVFSAVSLCRLAHEAYLDAPEEKQTILRVLQERKSRAQTSGLTEFRIFTSSQ